MLRLALLGQLTQQRAALGWFCQGSAAEGPGMQPWWRSVIFGSRKGVDWLGICICSLSFVAAPHIGVIRWKGLWKWRVEGGGGFNGWIYLQRIDSCMSWSPIFHQETSISHPARTSQLFFFPGEWACLCTIELTAEVCPTSERDVSCGPAWQLMKEERGGPGRWGGWSILPGWPVRWSCVVCQSPAACGSQWMPLSPVADPEGGHLTRGMPAVPATCRADAPSGSLAGKSRDQAFSQSWDSVNTRKWCCTGNGAFPVEMWQHCSQSALQELILKSGWDYDAKSGANRDAWLCPTTTAPLFTLPFRSPGRFSKGTCFRSKAAKHCPHPF